MRSWIVASALLISTNIVLAGENSAPKSGTGMDASRSAPKADVQPAPGADAGRPAARPAIGLSPKILAKKKARAAAAARGRAEFNAAFQQQAILQQSAALREDALARQQLQALDPLQQQRMLQQLSPQGTTVVSVRPDGTYQTRTYYAYPTVITPGTIPPANLPIYVPFP